MEYHVELVRRNLASEHNPYTNHRLFPIFFLELEIGNGGKNGVTMLSITIMKYLGVSCPNVG